MKPSTVIVNLKHYANSSGPNAETFLNSLKTLSVPAGCNVIFALNPIDLRIARDYPELTFISQHVDAVSYGAHTGHFSMESLKGLGINGSIINHSERRLDPDTVRNAIVRSKGLDFRVTVCCESLEEVKRFSSLEPYSIAYEPPELIGGNVSVTTSRPEIIKEAAEICHNEYVKLLVGAGIKNRNDVTKSIELGADGVLLASGVVLSNSPLDTLNSLIVNL